MKTGVTDSPMPDPERVAANWILRRDAGLEPGEEADLQDWLAADPRHAAALARKANAWSALERPLRHGQAGVLLERLEANTARRRRRQLAGGAVLVASVAIAGWFLSLEKTSVRSLDGRGVVILPEKRVLPDGSIVELRPGARIEVDFSGAWRRVSLQAGAAFFDVAKDPARPFVVSASRVECRALGTAFAVELAGERVDLLVTAGRVAVARPPQATVPTGSTAAGRPSPEADLHRGRRGVAAGEAIATVGAGSRIEVGLEFSANAPAPIPTAISAGEIDDRLAWRVPRLEFSELPLGEAVALMNRHNRVQFEIRDPGIARLRVSGLFRANNIETFVRLLEGTCGLEARRDGDTIFLRKAGD